MTLISEHQDSEIQELKARVTTLEEHVAYLQTAQLRETTSEQVIYIRTVMKEDAKAEIAALFDTTEKPLYYSDIMEQLGIELELVVEICKELIEEGVIGVNGNTV